MAESWEPYTIAFSPTLQLTLQLKISPDKLTEGNLASHLMNSTSKLTNPFATVENNGPDLRELVRGPDLDTTIDFYKRVLDTFPKSNNRLPDPLPRTIKRKEGVSNFRRMRLLTSGAEFALFPELPKEIRLMIWGFAADNHPPRLIKLQQVPNRDKRGDIDMPDLRITASGPENPILQVNQEARSALNGILVQVPAYQFADDFTRPRLFPKQRAVRINFFKDRLVFTNISSIAHEHIFLETAIRWLHQLVRYVDPHVRLYGGYDRVLHHLVLPAAWSRPLDSKCTGLRFKEPLHKNLDMGEDPLRPVLEAEHKNLGRIFPLGVEFEIRPMPSIGAIIMAENFPDVEYVHS